MSESRSDEELQELMALDAVIAPPSPTASCWLSVAAGQRTPMQSLSPNKAAGTRGCGGSNKVKGPGQKAAMRRSAIAGTVATTAASCGSAPIITGRAFDSGRPFTVYRRAIASGRMASTANPYTVSVG